MKIKKYSEFDTLYIFDFDDTIVNTPSFEDTIVGYLNENITAKDLLDKSLSFINAEISDLNLDNGRIFINDPERIINIKGNWVRKKKRVYLQTPNVFGKIDISWPKSSTELSKLYNSLENKCILTARSEYGEVKLVETLTKLNLDMPKYGIYMRPDKLMNAGIWKGEKIIEILKEHNFNSAIFYDDNSKYLKAVKKVVSEYPEYNIELVKVK
jgi:hypothetical protein